MNSVTSKQISEQAQQVLTLKSGSHLHMTVEDVLPADQAHLKCLVFASDLELFKSAASKKVQVFIVKENIWSEVEKLAHAEMIIWSTPNIPMAMSLVLPLFDLKAEFLKPGVHVTAFVHPHAQVDPTAYIGAHCSIEAHAKIGAHSILYASVYVGAYCEIGDRCLIGPMTTIGADGFSFFTDKQNSHHKIPQIGRAIIEDDCELGAHCAVDRAALTETRVGKGTKMDNYCHIAHNVTVGENSLLTAGFMVAGSTKMGKNLVTAGAVHVTGHIQIADNVVLTGRSGVTSSIKESGVYGGYPLETHRESLKTLVSIPQIKIIKKQVARILKHLNLNTDD